MAMTILMLQAFARQRGSSRCSTNQESASTHVRSSPDQIADTLQPEHRVVNKKWDRIDPVIGISSSSGDKRADGPSFSDPFFKNLSIFCFFVIEERIHIDRLIELPHAGINSDLAE